MTGITNPGNYESELPLQAVEEMLSTPQINLIYSLGAELHYADAHKGDTSRMSRLERLNTAGGRLDGSGIDPAPEIPVRTDVDAKMEIYAKAIVVNEQVELFSSESTQAKYKILLGQWLREKEDFLMRDLLADNVVYTRAVAGVANDDPTEAARPDWNNMERRLMKGSAKTMLSMIEGTLKFGTAPIRSAYMAFVDADLTVDLQEVDGVKLTAYYPSQEGVREEEYCQIGRFRVFQTEEGIKIPNASLNGNDIYRIPACGIEGYAKLEQNKYTAKVGIIPKYAMSTVAQNYGMYAKFAIARAITNQSWVDGLEVTKNL